MELQFPEFKRGTLQEFANKTELGLSRSLSISTVSHSSGDLDSVLPQLTISVEPFFLCDCGFSIWISAFKGRRILPSRMLVIDCPSWSFGHLGQVGCTHWVSSSVFVSSFMVFYSRYYNHALNFKAARKS